MCYVAGLAAAVVPLAYLADRFLEAARPGAAVPRKYVISGDCIETCQRFDRLGGVRGERRDLGAARPRGHRVGGECVPREQGAERCDVQGGAAGGVAGRQDDPRAARDVQGSPSPKVATCCSLGVRSPPCRALDHKKPRKGPSFTGP